MLFKKFNLVHEPFYSMTSKKALLGVKLEAVIPYNTA